MAGKQPIRREQGLLPSQAADNLFWIGRYAERLHQTSRVIRALIGQVSGTGAETKAGTALTRLANLLRRWGAVPPASIEWFPLKLAETALTDTQQPGSVRKLAQNSRDLALLLRDRLTRDTWRIINRPFPEFRAGDAESIADACDALIERYAGFVRMGSDGMSRNPAWRFLDLGLSMERAQMVVQTAQTMVPGKASAEDLSALLDLVDSQTLYRSRYLALPTIPPVLDMVLLDPEQPLGLAFQLARIEDHLAALPALRKDGMPERPLLLARQLRVEVEAMDAEKLAPQQFEDLMQGLLDLSREISRAYFLQANLSTEPVTRTFLA